MEQRKEGGTEGYRRRGEGKNEGVQERNRATRQLAHALALAPSHASASSGVRLCVIVGVMVSEGVVCHGGVVQVSGGFCVGC